MKQGWKYLLISTLLAFICGYLRGFCLRIIAHFLLLNERCAHGGDGGFAAVFRSGFFSMWKELSQLQGKSPCMCSAPLDRGNKARGGPIRIWLLGNGPEKDARFALFRPFYTSLLRSSCSLPLGSGVSSQSSCAGIPMFLADGQTSSLAPAQRKEKIGHANAKQWNWRDEK